MRIFYALISLNYAKKFPKKSKYVKIFPHNMTIWVSFYREKRVDIDGKHDQFKKTHDIMNFCQKTIHFM